MNSDAAIVLLSKDFRCIISDIATPSAPPTAKKMVTNALHRTPYEWKMDKHATTILPVMEEVNNSSNFMYPAASTNPPTKAKRYTAALSSRKRKSFELETSGILPMRTRGWKISLSRRVFLMTSSLWKSALFKYGEHKTRRDPGGGGRPGFY